MVCVAKSTAVRTKGGVPISKHTEIPRYSLLLCTYVYTERERERERERQDFNFGIKKSDEMTGWSLSFTKL